MSDFISLTALNYIKQMYNELNCRFCHKILTNPHSLPCQHHFCRDCIPDDNKCPVITCNCAFYPKDVSENHSIQNLVQIYQDLSKILIIDDSNSSPISPRASSNNILTTQEIKDMEEKTNTTHNEIEMIDSELTFPETPLISNFFSDSLMTVSSPSPITTSSPPTIVLLGTGLNKKQQEKLKNICNRFGVSYVDNFTETVTHVITNQASSVNIDDNPALLCKRTMKIIFGIITGSWIMSFSWIEEAERLGFWPSETDYQIKGVVNDQGAYHNHEIFFNNKISLSCLFNFISFYFLTLLDPHEPDLNDIKKLIKLSGGKILEQYELNCHVPSPSFSHLLSGYKPSINISHSTLFICPSSMDPQTAKSYHQKYNIIPLSVMWILDSITSQQFLPFNKYSPYWPYFE